MIEKVLEESNLVKLQIKNIILRNSLLTKEQSKVFLIPSVNIKSENINNIDPEKEFELAQEEMEFPFNLDIKDTLNRKILERFVTSYR